MYASIGAALVLGTCGALGAGFVRERTDRKSIPPAPNTIFETGNISLPWFQSSPIEAGELSMFKKCNYRTSRDLSAAVHVRGWSNILCLLGFVGTEVIFLLCLS